jgi:hypothetical protein
LTFGRRQLGTRHSTRLQTSRVRSRGNGGDARTALCADWSHRYAARATPPIVSPSAADHLLDEQDLVALFKKKHVKSIRRLVIAEKLPPHFRLGSKKYWRRGALMNFIARNESANGLRTAPKRARRVR